MLYFSFTIVLFRGISVYLVNNSYGKLNRSKITFKDTTAKNTSAQGFGIFQNVFLKKKVISIAWHLVNVHRITQTYLTGIYIVKNTNTYMHTHIITHTHTRTHT